MTATYDIEPEFVERFVNDVAVLKTKIKELYAVARLGFYGTVENHERWKKIVNDDWVLAIVKGGSDG